MGTLIEIHHTRKSILRMARREMAEMYRRSGGGQDPIPDEESRELFENGFVEEVKWQDWETYCRIMLDRIFTGN